MAVKDLTNKLLAFYANRYRSMAGYQDPAPYPPLPEMMDYLCSLAERDICLYGFNRETMRDRFSLEEKRKLIECCISTGEKFALEMTAKYQTRKPSKIAEKLGITIKRPDMPVGGGRVLFAEFEEPNEIRIYQDAIKNADKAIAEYSLENRFSDASVEDILIAHELFHFVEKEHKEDIFTLNYKMELWRIGPFRYTSKIVSLSEIAAMCFAEKLLELPFSPYVLDVFLSYTYQQDAGGALYHEIRHTVEAAEGTV